MNKKKWMSILLCLMLVFTCITPVFADTATTWTAEDFTYGEQDFELYPAAEIEKKITIKAWVVTGLSESGTTKLESNKDIVIPAKDPNGKKVQGVGNNVFNKKGLTSVTFPENVTADYDDTTWATVGKGLTKRGDFFIGASAFLGNAIENLVLPEGVAYVGNNAFKQQKSGSSFCLKSVKLPKTVMQIWNGAFAQNSMLTMVDFPAKSDFGVQIDNMAFFGSNLTSVQLPENIEKMHAWSFRKTGTNTTLYIDTKESDLSSMVDKSPSYQTIVFGKDPAKVTSYEFSLEFTEATYTGEDIKPAVKTEQLKEANYNVAYENCKDAGTAKAVITGNAATGFYGTVELEYKIKPAALPNGELEYTEVEFEDGKAYEPKVTVGDLVEGTDFTVEYKDNAAVGTAKAVVTGTGNYEGTYELEFTIEAAPTGEGDEGEGGEGEEEGKDVPKTGDNAPLALMMALMLAAAAGGYTAYRRNYTK